MYIGAGPGELAKPLSSISLNDPKRFLPLYLWFSPFFSPPLQAQQEDYLFVLQKDPDLFQRGLQLMADRPSRTHSAGEGIKADQLGLGPALLAVACSTLSGPSAPSLFWWALWWARGLFTHSLGTSLPVALFLPHGGLEPLFTAQGTILLHLWNSCPTLQPLSRGPHTNHAKGFCPYRGRWHSLLSHSRRAPLG